MKFTIKKILFSDIPKDLLDQAKKERIIIKENINLIGLFVNGCLVGFSGYIVYPKKTKLVMSFIQEQYRSNGFYQHLIDFRLSILKRPIYANCTKHSLGSHLKRGAKIVKSYKTIWVIKYE